MKLTLDFTNAYLTAENEIHDVSACYSKTGLGSAKLIVIGSNTARFQNGRHRGKSLTNHRAYGATEVMAGIIIQLLTGKEADVAPRERGWIGPAKQAFTCEPKKKSFFG